MGVFKIVFHRTKVLIPIVILLAAIAPTEAQTRGDWGLSVKPEFLLPLGADGDLFSWGGGATAAWNWRPWNEVPLLVGVDGGYEFLSTKASGTSLSAGNLSLAADWQIEVTRDLSWGLGGSGGYFAATFNGGKSGSGTNPLWGVGTGLGLNLGANAQVTLGAQYRNWTGLLGGAVVQVGFSFSPGGGGRDEPLPVGYLRVAHASQGLQVIGVALDSLFPVFFKHYDDHPIGKILVKNYEKTAVQNPRLQVNVGRFMDAPKSVLLPGTVAAGATIEVPIFGLFSDKILNTVEATKVPVDLTLNYEVLGDAQKQSAVATMSVLDRNAITWDDDRKAAAFVSAKDPAVLQVARSVSLAVKDLKNPGLVPNLQTALALHETLRSWGVAYVKDPTSALETNDKKTVDFVAFPSQTLGFRSGKCSDLTVLYCSLLESIGVPTALITVPGHILMAVGLEIDPREAKAAFSRPEDLIVVGDQVWLPLETTMRTASFQEAWKEGGRQWRAGTEAKTAAFYPVRDAWGAFAPVSFSGATNPPPAVDNPVVAKAFAAELSSLVAAEVGPRQANLLASIKQKGATPELTNRLGVLFARFGEFDKAFDQFSAGAKANYPAALQNLGNLYFLRAQYTEALGQYNKVLKLSPGNGRVLLAVARVHEALGRYDEARTDWQSLNKVDASLAASVAYLAGQDNTASRASAVGQERSVTWQE